MPIAVVESACGGISDSSKNGQRYLEYPTDIGGGGMCLLLSEDILPYRQNRMGDQMISALLVTKSWHVMSAKYGAFGQEGTPAHVEESTTELGPNEVDNEKRGLRYDADSLRRMVPFTTNEEEDDDGSHPSDSDADGEGDQCGAYSEESMIGSQGLTGAETTGLSRSLERAMLNERLETPSQSTPRRRGKRVASESVNLTPSMASLMNKRIRVRPGKAINYKL